jgi:hypothetical protein
MADKSKTKKVFGSEGIRAAMTMCKCCMDSNGPCKYLIKKMGCYLCDLNRHVVIEGCNYVWIKAPDWCPKETRKKK